MLAQPQICGDGPTGDASKDASICSFIDEYRNTAIEQHNEASDAGCSGFPPKSPDDIAPECGWCSDEE
jgi:hypothetical protein